MSTRQYDPAPRSRLRSPAAIVLVLFIMVGGYFWGRQFNVRDIAQRDAAIQQLQSDGQRLAADIADQNANLTALRAELTSTKAALNAVMPSQNTYNIFPNQSLIAADGRLTIGMIVSSVALVLVSSARSAVRLAFWSVISAASRWPSDCSCKMAASRCAISRALNPRPQK